MSLGLLPQWRSDSPGRKFRRCLTSPNGVLGTAIFTVTILFGLLFYITLFPPRSPLFLRPSNSHDLLKLLLNPPVRNQSVSAHPLLESMSVPEDLTVEQIRDIIAPTRGFFSRDYSLGLGWNNVRYITDAALLQAELLDRTLVVPSFIYARTCAYELTVCADYATMVDKSDAIGSEEWRELPIEEQMGFRIPISLMIDLSHLRARHPVITTSEFLRLHGQDPERESSSGFWPRESYHINQSVFHSNTPSLFIIENHWYDPAGTIRVDYIPEEMKRRGRYSASDNQESDEYWPEEKQTIISKSLSEVAQDGVIIDWYAAKNALKSSRLGLEVDLNDPAIVERELNANGWEVLHTFSHGGNELDRTVVFPIKQVVPRSTIRGFKDDYYDVDADVVVLAGETHLGRKVGAMRFTSVSARARFADMVVHSFIPPQQILHLAEVLATRMRELNGGRLWMGAHMRRGDFINTGWVMESSAEDHVRRVKDRLEAGRSLLANLGNVTAYDIEGIEPNAEQTRFPPPLPDDLFYISTDERDPEALEVIKDEGGVFLSDLLTIEDRRIFGWPLLLVDVRGVLEQAVLAHSAYFYGHLMSSFAGAVVNKRAARGADRRTALLD